MLLLGTGFLLHFVGQESPRLLSPLFLPINLTINHNRYRPTSLLDDLQTYQRITSISAILLSGATNIARLVAKDIPT